ncbi:MAG: 3-deoxy-7-phosphoheptulonate synthase [candidate division Zixibacteria bacterium]|nr:3-deoxy-7-phosphoheptulonate synthase [candidate division Zixibacteria bacterium]
MIIVMRSDATEEKLQHVLERVQELGFKPHLSRGEKKTIIGVVGNGKVVDSSVFQAIPGVESVMRILQPFKLSSREFKEVSTEIKIGHVTVGGKQVVVMAGPCAVETREQMLASAEAVSSAGAKILRGGAFKPRTSPYSFQGLGEPGLVILREVGDQFGMPVVTEVVSPQDVKLVASYADVLQVGARNMQNFSLLEEVGKTRKPVLLKRGLMATVEELLMSAEYILSNGNPNVMLCERGIRSFEKYTRNTLDISAVPIIKTLSHLPVIVDPSHAVGKRDLVAPVSKGSVATGADGLIIEVHPDPERALSDGAQSMFPADFADLMDEMKHIAEAVKRTI